VHVISYKTIREYKGKHPDSAASLDNWYRVTAAARWENVSELKQVFGTADFVAPFVVFNIGGNKYRLIAEINFRSKTVFIRYILTHKEYDAGKWRN
jgi:mRNA interferase HigB